MSVAASRVLAVVVLAAWVCSRPRPARRRPTWHVLGIPAEYASRWRWT